MVATRYTRAAFTMIELIFAIIIISMSVITLPQIIQITSKTVEGNIVQEAIFAASAELMGATSYYWDLSSMQDYNLSHLSRVVDIEATCESNSSSSRYRLRLGHVEGLYHRRCLESSSDIVSNIADANFLNLNNTVHGNQLIFTNETKDAKGYKDSYYSTLSATQGLGDANIKELTLSVTKSDGTPITTLKSYCANIGEVDYYKRRF